MSVPIRSLNGSSLAILKSVYFESPLVVGCCRLVTRYFYSKLAVFMEILTSRRG